MFIVDSVDDRAREMLSLSVPINMSTILRISFAFAFPSRFGRVENVHILSTPSARSSAYNADQSQIPFAEGAAIVSFRNLRSALRASSAIDTLDSRRLKVECIDLPSDVNKSDFMSSRSTPSEYRHFQFASSSTPKSGASQINVANISDAQLDPSDESILDVG